MGVMNHFVAASAAQAEALLDVDNVFGAPHMQSRQGIGVDTLLGLAEQLLPDVSVELLTSGGEDGPWVTLFPLKFARALLSSRGAVSTWAQSVAGVDEGTALAEELLSLAKQVVDGGVSLLAVSRL